MGELFDAATHPLYSVMAFTCALFVAIVGHASIRNLKIKAKHHIMMFLWVFLFCIQDGIWGLYASHIINDAQGLYNVSYIFHIFAICSCGVWTAYFIYRIKNRLKEFDVHMPLRLTAIALIVIVQLGMLIANTTTEFMFYVDEHGEYVTTDYRAIMFYIQLAVYVFIVLETSIRAIFDKRNRKNWMTISLVSLAPIVSGIFQMIYPNAPYDSIGFTLGCLLIHSFLSVEYEQQVIELESLRRALNQALDDANAANNAKTAFLFSMSHDIRTPMNAITGYASLAKKYIGNTEQVKGYLDKIDVSGTRLLALINQVLEMSRVESGKVVLLEVPTSIKEKNEVIDVIFSEQARSAGIELLIESKNIVHDYVLTDGDRLDQIINNVISNAIKYTKEGGTVKYSVEERACDTDGYGMYVFTVADTGIGMSKEFIPKMFETFSRAENSTVSRIQGTGLGMPIVKKLVELMKGSIDIESKLGEGTTFTISIPMKITSEPKSSDEKTEKLADISLAGMRVLLVEDNEMNREIAGEILTDYDVEVEFAEDGDIAVEMVQNAKPGWYNLILMDIQLPRMDGYTATKMIRAIDDRRLASIPIIAMTANAFEEDRQNAIKAGMNGHLGKPIDVEKLVDTLMEYIK